MKTLLFRLLLVTNMVVLLVTACNLGQKPLPPTPTATQLAASKTPIPATETLIPPSDTPLPPTSPPSATSTITLTPSLTPLPLNQAKRITFLPGSISAGVESPLSGGAIARYVLAIRAGQTLTVTVASPTQDVFPDIYGADGVQLKQSRDKQPNWSGKLPTTQDYFINVVSTGKDTRFTLQIIIPSAITPTPTSSSTITAENVTRLVQTGKVQLNYPNQLYWKLNSQQLMALDQNGINLVTPGDAGLRLSLKLDPAVRFLDFSSDGSTVALSTDANHIELRSLLTWQLERAIETTSPFTSAVFSPDGHMLAVVITDKIAADLYDVTNGSLVKEMAGFQTAAPVFSVRFSPDSRYLIWISRATVQDQEIASGSLGSILNHEDFVGDATLSPDNKILATVSAGQANSQPIELVKLWDPVNGSMRGQLTETNGLGSSLAFSPDGKLLAAASGNTFAIWDAASQKKLVVLAVDTDAITRVAFSPDGQVLATASADGWLRLWRIGP